MDIVLIIIALIQCYIACLLIEKDKQNKADLRKIVDYALYMQEKSEEMQANHDAILAKASHLMAAVNNMNELMSTR
jgi:hypothetical protein